MDSRPLEIDISDGTDKLERSDIREGRDKPDKEDTSDKWGGIGHSSHPVRNR